ncbi:MAG TPA: DUF4422 domain-containing protein [Clostridiales bacterium]|nr:DUF4422 domain-containing protein [Clostridiales bacterium]
MNDVIAIYGAQLLAGSIYVALKSLYRTKVECFIVSEYSSNPSQIDNIEVLTLSEYLLRKKYNKILIAVPEEHHSQIVTELKRHGISDYSVLTSQMRNQIMEEFYASQGKFVTLRKAYELFHKGRGRENQGHQSIQERENNGQSNFITLYMARSSKDKELEREYTPDKWIEQVQAGAAIDGGTLGILRDDFGINISEKNRVYCELTVLYWLWKNNKRQYMGLCHYRRIFDINMQECLMIQELEPDVILPYPTIHFPNIRSQHKRYISELEWKILQEAVLHISPEMTEVWEEILDSQYFYNYNMVIARYEVMNNYCLWLFKILEYVEKLCKRNGIPTSNRFAGYMGEILTTVYFLYKRNLNILHIGVNILL